MAYTTAQKTKVCNCIGAENCKDETCELVKKHKQRQKSTMKIFT